MQVKTYLLPLLLLVALAALVAVAVFMGGDILSALFGDFMQAQRYFHDRMADDMRVIADTHALWPSLTLSGIGFAYGVFHAVGPGHGKVVVTSYMLANERSLRRGLYIVALSSLMQALVAIVIVLGLFYALGLARTQTEEAAQWLEAASFALIAVVGFGLVKRGVREGWQMMRPHKHEHHHDHHHDHHHHHDHDEHCGCGHNHMPTPQEVIAVRGIWPHVLMIVSIGIRPCSGAIILLLFACLVGAVVPGIFATLAMAVGTAITTSALAIAAVQSKNWILRTMKSTDHALGIAHALLALVGGAFVMALGIYFAVANIEMLGARSQQDPVPLPLMHMPVQR